MHNNRAYHQEVMHLQRMANRHNRGITRAHIGTTIDNPNIDFAKIAQGMGVNAQGPITNPERSGSGDQAGDRGRQARRAVADRRRHAAAVGDRPMRTQKRHAHVSSRLAVKDVRLQVRHVA